MLSGPPLDPLLLTPGWQVVAGALAWVLHALCLGGGLMRAMGLRAPNAALRWFLQCALGMSLNILALLVLGLCGGFQRGPVLAWAALALGACAWVRMRAGPMPAEDARDRLLSGLIAWVLLPLVTWGGGGAPGLWDDTMYHLPLARSYVEHGGVVLAPHLRFPLFPQNMNLVQGLGLMFGDVRLAQALSTLPLGLIALGLVGATQWLLGSRFWGLLAGALLWLDTPVRSTWGYAYVDNGLGLFCWAAVLALALAAPTAPGARWRRGWVAAAALLAATAAGTKYFGAVFAVLLGMVLLPSLRRRDPALPLYAALGVLLGSSWYVRAFWISGDPLHPAGGAIFGHFLWTADDLVNQQAEQAGFGVQRLPWLIVEALQVAGFGWWGLAVAGLWGLWRRGGPVRVLQWAGLLYLAFWFMVTQVERYLAPIYGVGSFLSVWALAGGLRWLLQRWGGGQALLGWLSRLQADPLACAALLAALCNGVGPGVAARAEHFAGDLMARPGHALMERANALRPQLGDQLTQLFFEQTRFFFQGTVHGDFFGPARYWQAIRCMPEGGCEVAGPQALADYARRFGSRMVVIDTQRLRIDLPAYEALFRIELRTPDGVLLVLREP